MHTYIILILFGFHAQAKLCKPDISEGIYSNLTVGGHTSLECELYNCDNADKVVFEKTNVVNSTTWTPVFEEINITYYQAIDTGNNLYSLNNRNEYHAFRKQRIMYVSPLEVEDQGKWRCVVYDQSKGSAVSQTLHLFFEKPCHMDMSIGIYSNLTVGGHASLECDISNCDNVERVVFEKTYILNSTTWTPVFEGINNTHYYTIGTNKSLYSLNNRNEYHAFRKQRILYISPLTVEDQGKWRCVSHDKTSRRTKSPTVRLFFKSIYKPNKTQHKKNNIEKRECLFIDWVSLSLTESTCSIDRIDSQPDVAWRLNIAKETQEGAENLPDEIAVTQLIGILVYMFGMYTLLGWSWYRTKGNHYKGSEMNKHKLSLIPTQTQPSDCNVIDCEAQTDNYIMEKQVIQPDCVPITDKQFTDSDIYNDSGYSTGSSIQQSRRNPIHNTTQTDSVDVQNRKTQMENNNMTDTGTQDHDASSAKSLSTHQTYGKSGFATSSGINSSRQLLIDAQTNRDVQDCDTQKGDKSMTDSGIQTDFVSLMDSTIHISSGEIKNVDIQTDSECDTNQKWASRIACSTEAIKNIQRTMKQMSEKIVSDADGSHINTQHNSAIIEALLQKCDSSLRNIQLSISNVERPESTCDEKVKAGSCNPELTDPIETDQKTGEFIFEDHLGMFGDNLITAKWQNQYDELQDKKTRTKAIEIFLKMSMNEKLSLVNGFEMNSNDLKAGDMIKVNGGETFELLQQGFGGYEPEMASILNESGIVDRKILHVFSVTFDSGKRYLLNGQNLNRITKDEYDNRVTQNVCTKAEPVVSLQEGDLVQLLQDTESVRTRLGKMKGVGWNHEMKECLGLPGIVFGVRDNGSANVRFINGKMWVMSPDVLTKPDLEDEILEEGDLVMVTMNKQALETWQREIGEWHKDTSKKSGKFGILRRMEETENSVKVEIGGKVFIFNKQAIRLVAKKSQIQQRDEGKIGYLSK